MAESEEKTPVLGAETNTSKASSEQPSIIPDEHREGVPGSEAAAEPKAHLHLKTFLAVFAVLLIYFAQLVSLVGAGAVSPHHMQGCVHNIPRNYSNYLLLMCMYSKAKPSPRISIRRPA